MDCWVGDEAGVGSSIDAVDPPGALTPAAVAPASSAQLGRSELTRAALAWTQPGLDSRQRSGAVEHRFEDSDETSQERRWAGRDGGEVIRAPGRRNRPKSPRVPPRTLS